MPSALKIVMLTVTFLTSWLSRVGAIDDRDPKIMAETIQVAFEEAPKYGIDPLLLIAVMGVESRWRNDAGCVTETRGCGLYQQVPRWSRRWHDDCWEGVEYVGCSLDGPPIPLPRNEVGITLSAYSFSESVCVKYRNTRLDGDLRNARFATTVALRHLSYMSSRYDFRTTIRAYNRGIGRQNDEIGHAYEKKVQRIYRALRLNAGLSYQWPPP